MNFDHIKLEKEQKELFIRIVEVRRKMPRDQWEFMYMIKGYPDLTIPAKNQKEERIKDITDGDIEELVIKGLLRLTNQTRHEKHLKISPEGFDYYEWLMKQEGKPVERIETHTIRYLDFDDFRKRYTRAYSKLKEAEGMLWSADEKKQHSLIGIRCREAMQEFAEQLFQQVFGKPSGFPKEKTVDRIRPVIESKSSDTGEAIQKFHEALLPYWGTVSDLVQRNVHTNEKKGKPINMEDSRRVVFQTMNIMMELHRTFGDSK